MTFIHIDTFNHLKKDVFEVKRAFIAVFMLLVFTHIYTLYELNQHYHTIYTLNEEVNALKASTSPLSSLETKAELAKNMGIMAQEIQKMRLSVENKPIPQPVTRTIIQTKTVRDTLFIPVITPVFADF